MQPSRPNISEQSAQYLTVFVPEKECDRIPFGLSGNRDIVVIDYSLHNVSQIDGEELEASELLAAYRPDYFVSGHNHSFPYASGQSWNQKLGEVRLLVPGQLLGAPFPNHIKLNTGSGELSWHTTSETWIPEDGLYDHLVLNFAKG